MRHPILLLASCIVFAIAPLAQGEDSWRAGAAAVNITPEHPMPMAGYASRGAKHAEGKLTDLFAKALVLDDAQGQRAVLVTLDLIGVDREHAAQICAALAAKHKLQREQIALNVSHTHTGPVVGKNLRPMHWLMLSDADRKLVDDYANFVVDKIVAAVGQAIEKQQPAQLEWGSGTATFATNRRNNKEAEVVALREAGKLVGPLDHDVPVLTVRTADGKLQAIVFGYACHNTTLDSVVWSGDYAAFAQAEVERAHPGVIGMFWAGCGGDQNPLPRRKEELARDYGRQLGEAVAAVIKEETRLRAIEPQLATTYHEIDLPLAKLPTRDELETETKSPDKYSASRAAYLLQQIDAGTPLSPTVPYPVATWRLGDDVRWEFLGGEVVVDYAIRLKTELGDKSLGQKNLWVAGYSNDVPAYIPSRRVLTEGGYEGASSMIFYGLPTVWSPEIEELIISEATRQAK